jgi:ATPase subunit of ABC transporter with duplicated ATPase domains
MLLFEGQKKTSLEHYSGDYQSYEINVQERKTAQMRARLAYEREKEKLKEFVSREGLNGIAIVVVQY